MSANLDIASSCSFGSGSDPGAYPQRTCPRLRPAAPCRHLEEVARAEVGGSGLIEGVAPLLLPAEGSTPSFRAGSLRHRLVPGIARFRAQAILIAEGIARRDANPGQFALARGHENRYSPATLLARAFDRRREPDARP